MSLWFPDVNVWLALSVAGHVHHAVSWRWLQHLPEADRLLLCRYTQLGILRLLTNQSVMGEQTLSLRDAWIVQDRWRDDTRIEFGSEPEGIESAFRTTTQPFLTQPASKWVGDCYLLAFASQSDATLVTFDKGLHALARKQGHASLIPS